MLYSVKITRTDGTIRFLDQLGYPMNTEYMSLSKAEADYWYRQFKHQFPEVKVEIKEFRQ